MTNAEYLGEKSYPAIVQQITEHIQKAKADTLEGNDLLNQIYSKLNESTSITPMLDIKQFIVDAEPIAQNDVTLQDVIDFCKEKALDGDLNYIINLCKEEHIKNLRNSGHLAPEETIQSIEEYFNQPAEEIEININNGVYDSLNSKLLKSVKLDLNKVINQKLRNRQKEFGYVLNESVNQAEPVKNEKSKLMTLFEEDLNYNNVEKAQFLGEKSYPAIVQQITERIQKAKADTLQGDNLLTEIYAKLNESKSITPMLDIKEFITNAESVANDDASLKDVVNFCKKAACSGDLNYIINLCKEEHFANLNRSGHPSPQDTIKTLEPAFNEPASIIEQGIKNGIFDRLNSKLLNSVKLDLGVEVHQEANNRADELNESTQYDINGIIRYCPIGITYEDKTNNRVIALLESDILAYDKVKDEFTKLNESDVMITNNAKRIMGALTQATYDPESGLFSLNENWDFEFVFNPENGKSYVGKKGSLMESWKEININSLKSLFKESVALYESQNINFNKNKYLLDADNIICLMEHNNYLVKFDNIHVIRNLNEGSYVMYNNNTISINNEPKLISANGKSIDTFESFMSLCESIKQTIKYDCKKLFEGEIKAEGEQLEHRRQQITSLMEEQKSLNENIEKVKNLKTLAEENSPAMDKLNEQHNLLNQRLLKNIKELNFYQNEFKLH